MFYRSADPATLDTTGVNGEVYVGRTDAAHKNAAWAGTFAGKP